MKKVKVNRTITMIILMMFITVTYASFNTNLFIDGKAYLRVDKDIRITNIHLVETEYNGYENTESEYTNHSVSTDVSLPRQASSLTYDVTISNVSDKRYKITDILEEAYDNKDVKYEIINASIGNIVEPHTEKTFQIKFTNNTTVVEEDDVYETKTYTFDYTGDVQEFVVPYDGNYTIELWGASGGGSRINNAFTDNTTGLGGYTSGTIQLQKNKTLYIYVGGKGENAIAGKNVKGGYNGGGLGTCDGVDDEASGGGGGATDIRFIGGKWDDFASLKTRIMVAAGGGGKTWQYIGVADDYIYGKAISDGYGGGLEGFSDFNSLPGTQTSGYKFGIGEDSPLPLLNYNEDQSGAGGGYYGGTISRTHVPSMKRGGAGGSSFISGHNGCDAITEGSTKDNIVHTGQANHYSGLTFTNTVMIDGGGYNWTTVKADTSTGMPTHDGTSTMTGNYGNGYAKITMRRKIQDGSEYNYDYTNGQQTFVTPYSGKYLLETWGAQGGASRNGTIGGYGGYSSGTIELVKNTTLYINNGGKGGDADAAETTFYGGYNGGGNASSKSASDTSNWGAGGGATHIGLESGLLSIYSDNSKLSNLLIVAGAGGGAGSWQTNENAGGSGGGYIGNQGAGEGFGTGGTQSAPGVGDQREKTTDNGHFGQGGNYNLTDWGAGGGSGYYGGGVGYRHGAGAGGGSGYIGNSALNDKVMYCYQCQESQDVSTKTVSTNSHSKNPRQNQAKEGNGYSRITLLKRTINQTKLTLDFSFEEYLNGNEYTFGYTGDVQTFTVPKTGIYKLETWGGQGGYQYILGGNYTLKDSYSEKFSAGYSTGSIKLIKGEKLYVYVGGAGENSDYSNGGGVPGAAGGYNGGGSGGKSNYLESWNGGAGGGGATHIATKTGLLSTLENDVDSILIVSGGSGGYSLYDLNLTSFAAGGGYIGNSGTGDLIGKNFNLSGGTQNSGYSFGQGQTAIDSVPYEAVSYSQSGRNGGGGGYYGGYAAQDNSNYTACLPGGGGSGYIGNSLLYDKHMTCYNCQTSDAESTKTISNTCSNSNPTSDCSKQGDGFAKITLLEEIPEYHFDYTGDVQEFDAPYNGIYKIELWGASGGAGSADESNYIYPGGKGAYTSGNIVLSKNQKLYLYVGKEGEKHDWDSEELSPASFNGGGAGGYDVATNNTSDGAGSGGGATDIRLTNGNWNSFNSLKSRIMVAAGGGGGEWRSTDIKRGQNGSGLYVKGFNIQSGYSSDITITDGTQFSGYKFGIGNSGVPSSNGSSIAGDGGGYWTGVYDVSTRNGIGGTSYISGHQGCVSITDSSTEDNITFVNDSNNVSCNSSDSTNYNADGFNSDIACSKHYSEMEFYDTVMIDGAGYQWTSSGPGNDVIGMPSHDGRTTMVGNTGNGHVKITLVQKSTDVVRDNLLLYFDGKKPGNTEGEWEDQSGNNLDGTIIDASFNRNALQLGTNSSGVSMGSKLIDLYKSSFTLEMYVTQYGTDYRDIIMGNYSDYNSMSIERGPSYSSTRKGRFYFNECQIDYRTGSDYIEFNAKHQLFYIFDKDNNKFTFGYDGKVIDTVENNLISDDYNFNNAYFFRDKRQGATTFDGEAYSVRIYDKVMSLNEMKSNYIYDKIYYK